ncbi:MAG: hypothetical protein NC033_05315 [Clostridiales bacterium]|nr:hypothetical protein [Clostridiales bacterium]
MNFFRYIDNAEIEERAYAYLFSLCDCAEMLYAVNNDEVDGLELTALGTEYEFLIPAILGSQKGQSWGMWGRIYRFVLTDEFKKLIADGGLGQMPQITEGVWLENLTLLSGDKVMYSTCSHEGYNDIDEDFCNKVSDFCRKEIIKTKLYNQMLERYKNLPKLPRNKMAANRSKLYDLNEQVENEWQRVIRGVPRWNDLTYGEYLSLAKPVFSDNVFEKLSAVKSFKELHPAGYPRTLGEIVNFRGKPDFRDSELMRDIERQLDMLDTVFYLEEGIDDWRIEGEQERTPTIIINRVEE